MTRKEYTLLAQTIENAENDNNSIWGLVEKLCRVLKEENPRFDAKTFLGKCGYSSARIENFLEDEEKDRQKMLPPDYGWAIS